TVCLPEDVQAEAHDWPEELFLERDWHVRRPPAEEELLDRAAELLAGAETPLIVAGGGAIYSEASAELTAFAEAHGIPVVESQAGKGVLPWDHPLNAGPVGANGGSAANALARDADVVLAVGTRLGDFVTASRTAFQHPDVQIIGLNVTPFDAGKLKGLPLVADARSGLRQLHAALAGRHAVNPTRQDEIRNLREEWTASVDGLREFSAPGGLAQSRVMGLVNDSFGGQATVICAAGSMPGDLLKLWRPEDPKAYHVEYGFSCMGYEIPAALGVKMAEPERETVVFIGDGSYLMLNSEIVTAVTEGLHFTVILVDNHGYQSIHGLQRSTGSPGFLNELRMRNAETGRLDGPYVQLDLAAHARALGAWSVAVDDEAGLEDALAEAAGRTGVRVIVVETDPEKRVPGFSGWWDVPVAETSGQDGVRAARAEYEQGRSRRRNFL
ncbi:MAG TPA: thiamine pyrophosphate-dependent enzyme, partial [Deinococcales bacterium]|nr:thiamine pyrophosphate-dependent enzyme [Deinococcales bacterium]